MFALVVMRRSCLYLVSFIDPSEVHASERREEGSGENRQVLMTAAGMWAAPITLLVAKYCTISHLENELYNASTYVSKFAVEDVSAATSRAAKELGCRQLKDKQYQSVLFVRLRQRRLRKSVNRRSKSLCYAPLPAVYDVLP